MENEEQLLKEAKEILEKEGYTVVKKNKYNFYPKEPNEKMSFEELLKLSSLEHKKVLEYLKDK